MKQYDAIILGAGGAGLMCAIHAGRRKKKVLIIDHAQKLGGKILISGGGRCNFTNIGTKPENYVSRSPDFCRTALAKYQPKDFIEMVIAHKIPFYEKKLGQLFCKGSAKDIVKMLVLECEKSSAEILSETKILEVSKLGSQTRSDPRFSVQTSAGDFVANHLVVATGGYSFPKIGATGIGFDIAKQFGHLVNETAPALDGFVITDHQNKKFTELAGISLDCVMSCNKITFRENLLFTHVGISGPAALQASLHWAPGRTVEINLLPEQNFLSIALATKQSDPKTQLKKLLQRLFVHRFADLFCEVHIPEATRSLSNISIEELKKYHTAIHKWQIKPSSTVGYHKAEVTRGGVSTDQLSAKTMQSKLVPGLFFIGEVVDVTGWLGGYNFQWAWASGWSAAQAL
jgi:predicted Rossmann fold flavoprotein